MLVWPGLDRHHWGAAEAVVTLRGFASTLRSGLPASSVPVFVWIRVGRDVRAGVCSHAGEVDDFDGGVAAAHVPVPQKLQGIQTGLERLLDDGAEGIFTLPQPKVLAGHVIVICGLQVIFESLRSAEIEEDPAAGRVVVPRTLSFVRDNAHAPPTAVRDLNPMVGQERLVRRRMVDPKFVERVVVSGHVAEELPWLRGAAQLIFGPGDGDAASSQQALFHNPQVGRVDGEVPLQQRVTVDPRIVRTPGAGLQLFQAFEARQPVCSGPAARRQESISFGDGWQKHQEHQQEEQRRYRRD